MFGVQIVHQPQETFHGQATLAFNSKAPAFGFKMEEKEVPEPPPLTDTKATTTYRRAISENDLKTSRTDFLQLRT